MAMQSKFKEWWNCYWDTVLVAGIVFGFIIFVIGIAVLTIMSKDNVVYEDTHIKCYGDSGEKNYNSKMEYYCYNKLSGEIVCEYDWARGSGNKPPQGCYL